MTLRAPALLLTGVLSAALALTACGSGSGSDGSDGSPAGMLQVATGFYPLEFLAQRIGGEGVEVENLSPPGAEPHDLELSPQQTARLSEVDLVLYLAGFQPAVDEAVAQQASDTSLDVTSVVELEPGSGQAQDPHLWLDPTRYAAVATSVAERLSEIAPDRAGAFTAAADTLRAELEELDAQYRAGLADCRRTEIVTSHDAFGYLARAYDLEQIPVTGLTPEQEPSPGRFAEVADLAKERGVTTIFFEDTASPKVAESLAAETGATAAVLTPLEQAPEQGDYLTAMRANLATLQDALGCSSP